MRVWILFIAALAADSDFWSKINDESMSDVMEHSPGFKQMIMSACEMITLGRAGYPKNIPKETVEKLCMKMYPPFANRGKANPGAASQDDDMYNLKAATIAIVAVGMVWYVWSSSAPDEVFQNAPAPTWEINRVAQAPVSPPAHPSPAVAAASQAKPAASPTAAVSPQAAFSPPVAPSPQSTYATSPASKADTSPNAEQVAEIRRARLSRFDSTAPEQS